MTDRGKGLPRRQWLDEANRYPIPDYTVCDFSAGQKAGPVQIFAALDNEAAAVQSFNK